MKTALIRSQRNYTKFLGKTTHTTNTVERTKCSPEEKALFIMSRRTSHVSAKLQFI